MLKRGKMGEAEILRMEAENLDYIDIKRVLKILYFVCLVLREGAVKGEVAILGW